MIRQRSQFLPFPVRMFALLAAAAILSSCVSAKAADPRAFESAPLFGMIYDHGNRPVAAAALSVDGKPGPESDLTGRFVIPRLSKGAHRIVVKKKGYETLSVDLHFEQQTQVLYLQMYSEDQLLEMTETALDGREWFNARDLLERAAKIDDSDPIRRYLSAVLAYRTGKPKDAAATLNGLIGSGIDDPSVYLFLADIYQYSLGQPERAAEFLRRYLEQKSDDDVAARLAAITTVDKSK